MSTEGSGSNSSSNKETKQPGVASTMIAAVKQHQQHKDLDDVESLRSYSGSSTGSSTPSLVRRKEEFVYIPYSSQIEQGLTNCCFGTAAETPVMLRSEKAQLRQQQRRQRQRHTKTQQQQRLASTPSSHRIKRFTSIIYGYSALFFFLAIHSYMTWRDENYHNNNHNNNKPSSIIEGDDPETQQQHPLALSSEQDDHHDPWNNPNHALFGIVGPPKNSRIASSRDEQQQVSSSHGGVETAILRSSARQVPPSSVSYSYETHDKDEAASVVVVMAAAKPKSVFSLFSGSSTPRRRPPPPPEQQTEMVVGVGVPSQQADEPQGKEDEDEPQPQSNQEEVNQEEEEPDENKTDSKNNNNNNNNNEEPVNSSPDEDEEESTRGEGLFAAVSYMASAARRPPPYQRPPNTIPFPPNSSPLYFDAMDEYGRRGYIANPTALKQSRALFLEQLRQQQQQQHSSNDEAESSTTLSPADEFWATLEHVGVHARQGTRTAHIPLSAQAVCSPGPGRGMEDEGGYKLFAEKIQIAPNTEDDQDNEDSVLTDTEEEEEDSNPVARRLKSDNKLLCAVYSHAGMYDLARTAALTWGYKCDGFLVFGDALSIPELGFVQLEHKGPEAYGNMWQKVRSIWAYLHHNYAHQYQYFHLGGDDMYVIPENLKWRLSQKHAELPNAPIFMGQQVPLGGNNNHNHEGQQPRSYVSGGPGYTLNRKALQLLVTQALPECQVDTVAPYEDRLLTTCLNRIGLAPMDSRDPTTGEQTYHGVAPHTLYTTRTGTSFHAKSQQYWQQQPHPGRSSSSTSNSSVGPQYGLESAARYSVSFHNLFHPIFMVRVHTLLYPELCPAADTMVQLPEEEEEAYDEASPQEETTEPAFSENETTSDYTSNESWSGAAVENSINNNEQQQQQPPLLKVWDEQQQQGVEAEE